MYKMYEVKHEAKLSNECSKNSTCNSQSLPFVNRLIYSYQHNTTNIVIISKCLAHNCNILHIILGSIDNHSINGAALDYLAV